MKHFLIQITFLHLSILLTASTHHVGQGYPYSSLALAANVALAGDSIVFHQGVYQGGDYISNLQGSFSGWINILAAPGDTVIINGGGTAWQISDGSYLRFNGFIFEQQTANGVNMDDGGTYSSPAHHIVFENCTFRDMNASGNNDLLKMSGVDSFEIRNCIFLNGSSGGGDAIDMVGCHDGLIKNCRFENMGAGSIQAKGGSRNVRIEANFFKNGGQRSLNLGGSTGMQYFRPDTAHYEAADLKVYSNIFIGSDAPVSFVGCTNTEVINNTIYLPNRWAVRILQENLDTQLVQCSNNIFRNNIIYRDNQLSTDCNVGPNTLPSTFIFSNNLWYHSQNPNWAGPSLPVTDSNSIIGQDPLFVDIALENFSLQANSPAIDIGYPVNEPTSDYLGNSFSLQRSAGAFEGNLTAGIEERDSFPDPEFFPNPFSQNTTLEFENERQLSIYSIRFQLYSILGNETFTGYSISHNKIVLNGQNLLPGIYFYNLVIDGQGYTGKLVAQ